MGDASRIDGISASLHLPFQSNGTTDVTLLYLAEGAANVVYRIYYPSRCGRQMNFPQLLRLRKDLPSSVTSEDTVRNFRTRIAPLFPTNNLVHYTLCPLAEAEDLIARCNHSLRTREVSGLRSKKRAGTYIAKDQNGILVTDMSPENSEAVMVEFKPKWLVQSPSAPQNATRCRTCALRDMRRATNVAPGRGHAEFCAFDLLSQDPEIVEHVATSIAKRAEVSRLLAGVWLDAIQPILLKLQTLQMAHNRVALSDFESKEDIDFSLAMTLRDCSVFVRLYEEHDFVDAEVRLADVDVKSPQGGKREKWAEMERSLVEGGWYGDALQVSEHPCGLQQC